MKQTLVALMAVVLVAVTTLGCGGGVVTRGEHIVTLRIPQHVIVLDGQCASSCQSARPSVGVCMTQCPTAMVADGPCPPMTAGGTCVVGSRLATEVREGQCRAEDNLTASPPIEICENTKPASAENRVGNAFVTLGSILLVGLLLAVMIGSTHVH